LSHGVLVLRADPFILLHLMGLAKQKYTTQQGKYYIVCGKTYIIHSFRNEKEESSFMEKLL